MSGPRRSFAAALLVLVSIPTLALAQDGFTIQTADGESRLQVSFLLQVEGRFAVDDPQNNIVDTFALRRLRPILQGRVAKYFDFYFNPDFAGGIVNIRDAYIDTRFSPAFRIRVGKGKEPFGLERLMSAQYLTFVERALPTAVAPDRDIGILALGDIKGGLVSYSGGVMNGVADGTPADVDTNDGKDAVGRIVVRPFAGAPGRPLSNLALAFAASTGTQPSVLPSFRSSGQQIFFAYDHAAIGEGSRNRVSPQATYYYKKVWGFGEYIWSRGAVRKDAVVRDITHESWQLAGSVVVSGEAASDRGVKPDVNFDPGRHALGALQLTARYHVLTVDPAAVTSGLAAAGSSHEARAFTIGANWYLNPYIKWVFNVERTVFDGDPNGPRHAENAVLIENQISF
jgi:phosphate-selective porin OprO/OprP